MFRGWSSLPNPSVGVGALERLLHTCIWTVKSFVYLGWNWSALESGQWLFHDLYSKLCCNSSIQPTANMSYITEDICILTSQTERIINSKCNVLWLNLSFGTWKTSRVKLPGKFLPNTPKEMERNWIFILMREKILACESLIQRQYVSPCLTHFTSVLKRQSCMNPLLVRRLQSVNPVCSVSDIVSLLLSVQSLSTSCVCCNPFHCKR